MFYYQYWNRLPRQQSMKEYLVYWYSDPSTYWGPWREKRQTACKPGSVAGLTARAMAIHLGRPSPGASRDRPGQLARKPTWKRSCDRPRTAPTWSCSRRGLPCRPRCRRRGALLPHPFTLARRPCGAGRAVCSLWHFPWGRPRRVLPGSVLPRSPDFPPPRALGGDGGHPAVWRALTTPRCRPGQAWAPPATSAPTRSRTAAVSPSIAPSTRAWRKCR